ncbi:MAG: dTMP kinase [Glaciecola sp.]|jgi:dTMP kinase|uniref:dTMP kinase n=1 Tax=Glaciecola sp. HTCC2999 TaxID=455436 RepID=UPI0000E0FA28|nr:dTMP kinase [Glaciecola sp. HTCC2999]MCH1414412.1 dTMP kinase [Glaciecola sp.]
MTKLGQFIVVEGLEGAGKSTVIKAIQRELEAHGHELKLTREPGGTPMAEAIRDCVKHDWQDEIVTEQTELLLMYAARSQLIENTIKPALANGIWVLGDRHDWSSLAYQGGGRQVNLAHLNAIRELTLDGFTANLTIYLDINPKVGLSRAAARGELDRIEQSGLAFFERARETYLNLVKNSDSAILIDAEQSIDKVREDVITAVRQFLGMTE